MMIENIVWVGKPSEPYDEKHKSWNQWTLWLYKIRDCSTEFVMNVTTYEIYLAEKAILEKLHIMPKDDMRKLFKAIDNYGQIKYRQGQEDEWESNEGD